MLDKLQASTRAIEYVAEMELVGDTVDLDAFKESSHMAVESVYHDSEVGVWRIGVGFVRDWNRVKTVGALAAALSNTSANELRTVKTVVMRDTSGELVSYEG